MPSDTPDDGLGARLAMHLAAVCRERDPVTAPDGHAAVEAYVAGALGRCGEVSAEPFEHAGRWHRNLVLDLPGREIGPPVLVGAHFDAVAGSPGADDNGSALAVLIEIARGAAATPPRRALRLVAFDLEEQHMAGSRAYARALSGRGERLHLMIALEMLGYRRSEPGSQRYPAGLGLLYPGRGDFIGLIGDFRSTAMLHRLARAMRREVRCEWLAVPLRGRIVPDTRRSDHAPFWDLGYPAIMVTDTANLRNPHYHRPTDTLETLDLAFLAGVCRGLVAGLDTL